MSILSLKKNDEFTILSSGLKLFIAKTNLDAIGPFVLTPPGASVNPGIEYWVMNGDEEVAIDTAQSITDSNPVNYPKLAGSRPSKSRRSK
jgi:hypothetical protein